MEQAIVGNRTKIRGDYVIQLPCPDLSVYLQLRCFLGGLVVLVIPSSDGERGHTDHSESRFESASIYA